MLGGYATPKFLVFFVRRFRAVPYLLWGGGVRRVVVVSLFFMKKNDDSDIFILFLLSLHTVFVDIYDILALY